MKNAAVGWRDEFLKKYIFVGINLFLLHVLNLYKSQYSRYQPESTRQLNIVNPKSLRTFVCKKFGHLVNLRNAKLRFSLFQDILIIYYANSTITKIYITNLKSILYFPLNHIVIQEFMICCFVPKNKKGHLFFLVYLKCCKIILLRSVFEQTHILFTYALNLLVFNQIT